MLLRGINVDSRNRIQMASLRTICRQIGCVDATTYIQSGNVVLRSSLTEDDLSNRLESAIAETTSLGVPVVVRSGTGWRTIIEKCPLGTDVDHSRLMLSLVHHLPADPLGALDPGTYGYERITQLGRETYLFLRDGQGRSKLAAAFARTPFGKSATTRNWRTVLELARMAAAIEP